MPKITLTRPGRIVAGFLLLSSCVVRGQTTPVIKTFPLGTGASGATDIAAGDVNGDGILDLVTSNGGSSNISVLLGQGRAQFAAAQVFATGSDPKTLALADFNRDGKLDVVTANFGAGSISVLFGNGDGTFQTHQDYSVGIQTQSVVVGDVNNDGIPDIVVSSVQSENTDVFLSNGDGTFQTPISFVFNNGYAAWTETALADMNGDGNLDFIGVFSFGQGFQIWLGNGDGTFTYPGPFPFGCSSVPYPFGLGIGDFNGDGKPDVAMGMESSSGIAVCLNESSGSEPSIGSAGPFATTVLAVGDVNGDGKPDVVSASVVSSVLDVEIGKGDGSFEPSTPIRLSAVPAAATVRRFVANKPGIAFVAGNEAGLILF